MSKTTAAICVSCTHEWRTSRKGPPYRCPRCGWDGQPRELKPSKYLNNRVEVDGLTFDSRKEARRWGQLRLMEQAGEIRDLQRQVRYPLEVDGSLVCTYVADFVYEEDQCAWKQFCTVVEDCKGRRTDVYLLKKKLMKAIHKIEVRET